MKKNSSFILFVFFLVMGITISISSNNWLGCWMGMEINLISFLPIMMNKFSVYSSESMIKYFIIQSMGSGVLFISIMLMLLIGMKYLTLISLMIKIGCPPFHLWFPSVMEGLSWFLCFILSTIQKFIPMVMLTYLNMNMIIFILMACVWGSLGGLGYSSMRKIISYSSIYNLGWMISGMNMLNYSWLLYFFIYSFTLFMVCYMMNMYEINYLNQMFIFSKNYFLSTMMMSIFMSMGGMPPFLGFFPKMILIYCLIKMEMLFSCLVLLISALLVMFFYLRIVLTGLMINSTSLKLFMNQTLYVTYMFGTVNIFGMFIMLMINFYF
uniref:NADH-ubiquinone oxidoreductase chain 2 n=1 Tax=Planopleura kaempferi TaxID=3381683 RepID=A0A343J8E0_9HEMI|nr:NADH dehydrogenase subunit 2 [Platypleura kaempferi]